MIDPIIEQNLLFKECEDFKREMLSTVAKSLRKALESSDENSFTAESCPGTSAIINNQLEAAFNLMANQYYARMLVYLEKVMKKDAEIINQNAQLELRPPPSIVSAENFDMIQSDPDESYQNTTKRPQEEEEEDEMKAVAIVAKKSRRVRRSPGIQAKTFTGEPYQIIVNITNQESLFNYVKKRSWMCPVINCNTDLTRLRNKCFNKAIVDDHLFKAHHEPDSRWICRECKEDYHDASILCTHYMSSHVDGPYRCGWPRCLFISTYRRNVYDHLKSEHRTRAVCPECKEEFADSPGSHKCRSESTWSCLWISSSPGDNPSTCGYQDANLSKAMKHVMEHLKPLEQDNPDATNISGFYYLDYIHRSPTNESKTQGEDDPSMNI